MVMRWSNAAVLGAVIFACACGDGLADGRFAGFNNGGTEPNGQGGTTGGSTSGGNQTVNNNSVTGCLGQVSPLSVSAGVSANAAPYDMALNSTGKPTVAWGAGGVQVSTWDGNKWQSLGKTLGNNASPPSLALSTDTPYVGWVETSGGSATPVVQSWNGSAWSSVGSLGTYTPTVATPILTLAVHGTSPAVAYLASSGSAAYLQLVRYSGGGWSPSTSGNTLTANATSAAMTIDATARVVLGWGGDTVNAGVAPDVALQPLTNSPVVASDSTATVSEPVAVALRSDGTIVVAYVDARPPSGIANAIVVKAWMNTYWTTLADSNMTTVPGTGISVPMSSAVNSATGPGHHISLAVDSVDGVWVAWEDAATQQIYMRTWNGTSWSESGASAHDKGVSSASAAASWPKLRMVGSQPVLSWLEGGAQLRVCTWSPGVTTATP